jgi:hypothetical protein
VAFLLVHPPLLGPAVWGPCAAELAAAGHPVAVPDLRAACDPPAGWAARAADAAAAGVTGRAVIAGHSGAGVLLPLIADRLDEVAAVVFVDALVPAAGGRTEPSGRFRSFLDELPVTGGLLPRWSDWWGPGALAELVPDPALRAAIEAEQPRLARAFYAETVPVPASWPPSQVAYLQLSPAYDGDAAEAAARGWPVRSLPGRHLDLATRPAEVAAAILALVERTRS